jgi:hypothetical protein
MLKSRSVSIGLQVMYSDFTPPLIISLLAGMSAVDAQNSAGLPRTHSHRIGDGWEGSGVTLGYINYSLHAARLMEYILATISSIYFGFLCINENGRLGMWTRPREGSEGMCV